MEADDLEACFLCPTNVKGYCQCFGKECVMEGHLVAYVKQHAIVRERQATDHKEEFQDIIEYMNVKQGRLLATMERKQKLMSGTWEEVWDKLPQGVLVLEDRISAEEAELLEISEEVKEYDGKQSVESGGVEGFV